MKKIDLDELLRDARSATPEELTAQRESYSKNYTPGPIQATPFMPNAISKVVGAWPGDETDAELLSALDEVRAKPDRRAILMEALRAVENERLETHWDRLREAKNVEFYRSEHGEDAAYSLAIHDAESAIKQLLEDKSKPVATTS